MFAVYYAIVSLMIDLYMYSYIYLYTYTYEFVYVDRQTKRPTL